MSKRQVEKTVAIRFPKALWLRVRRRALERGETGLSYLSRCAEVCLETAETGIGRGGVVAAAVEPVVVAEPPKELRYGPVDE